MRRVFRNRVVLAALTLMAGACVENSDPTPSLTSPSAGARVPVGEGSVRAAGNPPAGAFRTTPAANEDVITIPLGEEVLVNGARFIAADPGDELKVEIEWGTASAQPSAAAPAGSLTSTVARGRTPWRQRSTTGGSPIEGRSPRSFVWPSRTRRRTRPHPCSATRSLPSPMSETSARRRHVQAARRSSATAFPSWPRARPRLFSPAPRAPAPEERACHSVPILWEIPGSASLVPFSRLLIHPTPRPSSSTPSTPSPTTDPRRPGQSVTGLVPLAGGRRDRTSERHAGAPSPRQAPAIPRSTAAAPPTEPFAQGPSANSRRAERGCSNRY